MIIKKCFFYYEFDEILKKSLIVNSSFVMKFTRSDFSQMRKIKETTKETNSTIRDKKDENISKSNVNDREYENWLIREMNFDSDSSSEDFLTQKSRFIKE